MKKIINLFYIGMLHKFPHQLSDEEIYAFDVNDENSLSLIVADNKRSFQRYTSFAKQQVLDAIEYLFSTGLFARHWRSVIPPELPLDDVRDKCGYLRNL